MDWAAKAQVYLNRLCIDYADRPTGSTSNQRAAGFFRETVSQFGFHTQTPAFGCFDWRTDGVDLSVEGIPFTAAASPYSLGSAVSAPLTVIATVSELAARDLAEHIVLLTGEIAREPLMPKNFPFYNPEEHQQIIRLLEAKKPLALITASQHCPQMAGALYPYPMFEDGDFDIPSIYMTAEEGERLAAFAGSRVLLTSRAQRLPARAWNVVAGKGALHRRIVFCAHIDAKGGTPGALDNASGITTLLLLAELLADYHGELGIEIVAINGEDYYANCGELAFLDANAGVFDQIVLGVNLDGIGDPHGTAAYSLYNCPPEMETVINTTFSARPHISAGDQWYQGDHMLFVMNQTPALAFTSARAYELMATVIHTAQDTPDRIAPDQLVAVAHALRDLITRLNDSSA